MYARIIPIRSNDIDKDEYNILYEDGTITKTNHSITSGTIKTGRFYDECFKDDDYYSPLLKNYFANQYNIVDYDNAKFDFNNKDFIFHANVVIPEYCNEHIIQVARIQNDLMLWYGNFKVNFHFDTPTGEVVHTYMYNFIVSQMPYDPNKDIDVYYIINPDDSAHTQYILDESRLDENYDCNNLIYMLKVTPDAPRKAGDTHEKFYKVIFGWQKKSFKEGFYIRTDSYYKMYHAQNYTDGNYGNTRYFHPFMRYYGELGSHFNEYFYSLNDNTNNLIEIPNINISDNHINIATFAPYLNDIFIADTDKTSDIGDVYWDRPFMYNAYPLNNYDNISQDTYMKTPPVKGVINMAKTYKSYYT